MRSLLRSETHAAHEATDAAFSVFDLTTGAGLCRFLKAHYAALSVVEHHLSEQPGLPHLPPRLDLIQDDLSSFGETGLAGDLTSLKGQDPVGVAYVVGGSALGGEVLRRRWEEGNDPAARGAFRYLSDTRMRDYWRLLQQILSAEAGISPSNDATIRAAIATFDVYTAAALQFQIKGAA